MKRAMWFSSGIVVIAIAAAFAPDSFNEIDDHSSEYTTSAELEELQASQAYTARREVAAQALCNKERGPNSEARWLEDGSLACTTARHVVRASL